MRRHDDICYGASRACRLPWVTATFDAASRCSLRLEHQLRVHESLHAFGAFTFCIQRSWHAPESPRVLLARSSSARFTEVGVGW
jgi:hypothetical protein